MYGTDNISYSMAVLKFFHDNGQEMSREELEEISIVFYKMKLSVREIKRCVERTISLINSLSDRDNLELYAYIACRYDKDFEKITPMEDIYDPNDEKEQLLSERRNSWNSFLSKCKYDSSNEKIWKNCIKIAQEFCIIKYVDARIGVRYDPLQNNIYECYRIICKDSGNAKKLAEIFLSDLFREINTALKNTK